MPHNFSPRSGLTAKTTNRLPIGLERQLWDCQQAAATTDIGANLPLRGLQLSTYDRSIKMYQDLAVAAKSFMSLSSSHVSDASRIAECGMKAVCEKARGQKGHALGRSTALEILS